MKVGVKGVLNLLFLFCLASSSSPSPLVRYGSRDHDLGEVLEDGGGDGNQLQINFQTDPRLPQTASSPSSLGSEYPDGFEIRIPHRGHDHKEDLIINSTTGKITPVPPSELTELKSLAHYSPPAFCREDILLNRTCGNACNSNELKELTDLEPFGDYDHGLFGYTAISHQKALIIIAFRGTRNFNNWVNNLLFAKADKHPFQSAPDDARVHYGFLKDYRLIKDDVYKRLIPLAQIYPDYDVLIIGHSLGGALSVICAMDLIDQFPDVIPPQRIQLLTLAQPRVGNEAFSVWVNQQDFKRSIHITNQNDLTPHLPPKWAGFRHSGLELFIQNEEGDSVYCTNEAETGEENKECADGIPNGKYSIAKHAYVWDMRLGAKECRNK